MSSSLTLWPRSDASLRTLSGHEGRVCRINFHPSGRYLGSASYDGTWRLWDVETSDELLLQEGHSKEVYAIAFQQDGALVASGSVQFFPGRPPPSSFLIKLDLQRSGCYRPCLGPAVRPDSTGTFGSQSGHPFDRLLAERVSCLPPTQPSTRTDDDAPSAP